jgi:hypothetical protein
MFFFLKKGLVFSQLESVNFDSLIPWKKLGTDFVIPLKKMHSARHSEVHESYAKKPVLQNSQNILTK